MTVSVSLGRFLESANVHGNLYGTSWDAIERVVRGENKFCLLDIDVEGVRSLKRRVSGVVREGGGGGDDFASCLNVKYVFIAPPSVEVLEERLRGRGTESEESLSRRLGNARGELEYGLAPGNFDCVVVNESLEGAVTDFETVVKDLFFLE